MASRAPCGPVTPCGCSVVILMSVRSGSLVVASASGRRAPRVSRCARSHMKVLSATMLPLAVPSSATRQRHQPTAVGVRPRQQELAAGPGLCHPGVGDLMTGRSGDHPVVRSALRVPEGAVPGDHADRAEPRVGQRLCCAGCDAGIDLDAGDLLGTEPVGQQCGVVARCRCRSRTPGAPRARRARPASPRR